MDRGREKNGRGIHTPPGLACLAPECDRSQRIFVESQVLPKVWVGQGEYGKGRGGKRGCGNGRGSVALRPVYVCMCVGEGSRSVLRGGATPYVLQHNARGVKGQNDGRPDPVKKCLKLGGQSHVFPCRGGERRPVLLMYVGTQPDGHS